MKKSYIIIIAAICIILVIILMNSLKPQAQKSSIGTLIKSNTSLLEYKITFKGEDGKDIYGLYFTPMVSEYNVIIVLPAAGGTKESREHYAHTLLSMGYASLIMDQRGLGETDGYMNTLDEDFRSFQRKERVHQMLMATDISLAMTFLEQDPKAKGFAVLGESMGGRNAILAAAKDPRIQTAIIISASGYNASTGSKEGDDFVKYINPNSYVADISPRRLLMLHAENDTVIALEDAKITYNFAKEPKEFVSFKEQECSHGYCAPMYPYIKEELKAAFT